MSQGQGVGVRNRDLRPLLVAELLSDGGPLSLADLTSRLAAKEITFPSRPSKMISDALRWEIRKGRVVRVRRGVYQATATIPRSTKSWIRQRAAAIIADPQKRYPTSWDRFTPPPHQ